MERNYDDRPNPRRGGRRSRMVAVSSSKYDDIVNQLGDVVRKAIDSNDTQQAVISEIRQNVARLRISADEINPSNVNDILKTYGFQVASQRDSDGIIRIRPNRMGTVAEEAKQLPMVEEAKQLPMIEETQLPMVEETTEVKSESSRGAGVDSWVDNVLGRAYDLHPNDLERRMYNITTSIETEDNLPNADDLKRSMARYGLDLWLTPSDVGNAVTAIVNMEHPDQYLSSYPMRDDAKESDRVMPYTLNMELGEKYSDQPDTLPLDDPVQEQKIRNQTVTPPAVDPNQSDVHIGGDGDLMDETDIKYPDVMDDGKLNDSNQLPNPEWGELKNAYDDFVNTISESAIPRPERAFDAHIADSYGGVHDSEGGAGDGVEDIAERDYLRARIFGEDEKHANILDVVGVDDEYKNLLAEPVDPLIRQVQMARRARMRGDTSMAPRLSESNKPYRTSTAKMRMRQAEERGNIKNQNNRYDQIALVRENNLNHIRSITELLPSI